MAQIDSFGEGEILQVISESPQFTHLIGEVLGTNAREGDVFCLEGELGSGKTCLVGGIAAGLGIENGIFSPSFIIIATHRGRIPLFHIDLYRLGSDDLQGLGLEEYIYGKGICAIEWAEKAKSILPPTYLWIRISHYNDKRLIQFFPKGERYMELLKELKAFARFRH
ncbi:MAG: tRNA (adenosine(37)-N6)-threonylcarbamoyltransferase complex ATPase subunit type 1 TsaE [bacterium]